MYIFDSFTFQGLMSQFNTQWLTYRRQRDRHVPLCQRAHPGTRRPQTKADDKELLNNNNILEIFSANVITNTHSLTVDFIVYMIFL